LIGFAALIQRNEALAVELLEDQRRLVWSNVEPRLAPQREDPDLAALIKVLKFPLDNSAASSSRIAWCQFQV
jgi:hypothetical protein